MTTLEIVLSFLLSQSSPFGQQPFTVLPQGEQVIVEFPKQGVTLLFDRDLEYEVIEGKVRECQPEGKDTDV